ncbi:MAG: sugar phosphate nucleotidyltransferase [Ignavibacteria bacterium]
MAGGFGTRLRPLTNSIPKPMAPLLNKPIIEHNINLLKSYKITDLIIILYYQSEVIRDYLKDGANFGVKIKYVKPDADYGTAGAVFLADEFIKDKFIVISGDVVTDFDLTKAISFHDKKKSIATLVLTHSKTPLQFGIVLTDKEGRITKFYEKPTWSEVFSDTINTGIYVLEKETMSLIPKAKVTSKIDADFSKDLFPYILRNNLPLYGYIGNGYWRDVGSLEDYISTNLDSLKSKVKLNSKKLITEEGNYISRTAKISKNAEIISSVIGDECYIGSNVRIKNSVLWNNVSIEENCKLTTDVICNNVIIKANTNIQENVFIGAYVTVGNNAELKSDVKIWPNKIIDSNSVVTRNLVWEERWKDTIFTDSRITGLSNIEITPEFSAKLGKLFGIFAGEKSRIEVSRDTDNVSRMIKGAIMSGLMSSGAEVIDLQTTPIPILRQELKGGKGTGGIFVRKSPFDATKCDIIFFDSSGKDLSTAKTKSMERLFFSEDFNPVPYHSIGSITFPERTYESYKAHFLANLNKEIINERRFKIAVNYSHGITSSIFPIILSEFNLELVSMDTHLDSAKQTRSPEEFKNALENLSYIVTSLKYDAGFLLDAGGEKIFMVNNTGKIISYDRFLSIVINLFLSLFPNTKKIAVPIQASGEIDIIAKKYGTEILRVKDSHFAMMNAAEEPDVEMVGGTKGGVIFPKFLFATDGMFSVMKILELLAASKKSLSEIEKDTPRLFMYKNNLHCSKEQKGKVMRKLVEESEGMRRQLIDGIKIFFDPPESWKWVLCIPDSEREIFHVNAEAKSMKEAKHLVRLYSKKIEKFKKNL